MSDTGFTRKKIDLTITLGSGSFGATVGDTVTLSGYRITVDAQKPGGESMGMANIRVFGMRQELMNKLTTIGQINRAIRIKNTVSVAAGDDETGMQLVFFGIISDALADYNASPEVAFNIVAYSALDAAVKPVGATSFKGPVDVVKIMQQFADEMGVTLEANDVSVILSNPYFSGTTLNKVRMCARAANISYTIDRGVLAIWRKNGVRDSPVPLISPDTGMVGYPTLSSKGMSVKMVFNWNIKLGANVQVQSDIPMACGLHKVFDLSHSLASETPNGEWFTYMDCYGLE